MSKTITSGAVTFMDVTDSRRLEIYITANHPTVQIYDRNEGDYTPDWSKTNLKLGADVFLNSEEIKPEKMMWYRQYINETTETLISSGAYTEEITINSNMTQAVATYICRVEYQGLTAFSKITFTKTDTGLNGVDGKDGTSVRILGTATAVNKVDNTDYYTITYSSSAIIAAELGDAYLYNGNLYVCAVKRDADDYFINVGNIQGPAGTNGVDAKLITLSSSSQVFKVSNAGAVTPATITVTATAINTSASTWTYSTDGGKTFSSTVPTGLSRNGNTVTVTGSTLGVNSVVIKASDGTYGDTLTVHKVVDGANGSKGDSASMAFLTNENISFAANAGGQISTTSLTTNVVAYHGTEKVMPTVGTPSGMPSGMTISVDSTSLANSSKEVMLTISIANNSTLGSTSSNHGTVTIPVTSPVNTNLIISWSKINAGPTGVGINSTTVTYGVSDSVSTQPTEWQNTIPTVAEGKYLWTRTIIDYTDTSKADTVTYTYAKQGSTGEKGNPGSSVTVSSIQYQEGSSATTAPTGTWSNAVVAVADGKYLWTKTTFSDGKIAYGVAKYGADGAAGVDAYTVLLTNESHVFAGNTSSAVAGSAETQVLAYKGTTAQTVTIVSVNGVTASTSSTATGIAGLTFACSALSGTSPKITFTCTTSFVSASGSIPVVISVGGVSFTKIFTYSIAFKGSTGSAATAYWLISSASVVQKSASGTVTLTPSTLTFTGKSKTGTSAPADYNCRWIIAYSIDGSTYTNSYTSSADEASKTFTVDSSYKSIRARMYLAGGTSTLLDEQIIPVVTDGAPGTSASLVNITPSALYFKSTTGANGTFTPQYIYLYPSFQNATYSSWQYSTDGGATWTSASGANGLTIGTYSSVANALRIDRTSTLYTSSVTSISFRCNSTNTAVYDIVSIAKIYDVVDLQIGGRNYVKNGRGDVKSGFFKNFSIVENGYGQHTLTSKQDYSSINLGDGFILGCRDYKVGAQVVMSYDIMYTEWNFPEGSNRKEFWMGQRYTRSSSNSSADGTWRNVTRRNLPVVGVDGVQLNEWYHVEYVVTIPAQADLDVSEQGAIQFYNDGDVAATVTFRMKNVKVEYGNIATDWSPAPEDLLNEAANVNVMLSNESHFFEATASGIPTAKSIVLDVIGYKGSVQSNTTVGTISGLPSAGMTATIASNGTTSTKITIAVTEALTSADSGVLTIPVTVNGYTINKKFSWVKAKAGNPGISGVDAVTFQVYSTNGYALSINTPAILLQTFAYVGDTAIQTGATFQWYNYTSTGWTAISGATNSYYTVSRDSVSFSNSYMCKMQFNGAEYVGVATIDDKSDENKLFTTKPSSYTAGDIWVVGVADAPTGVEPGTILRAQYTRTTYNASDWIEATKYDQLLNDLKDNLDQYNQYFSFNSTDGIKITAKDNNGVESKYSTTISNDRWAINYGSEAVTYVDETKMHIKEAEIESPLSVTGKYSGSTMLQAPIINIGNFSLVVESNGSLSVVVKS